MSRWTIQGVCLQFGDFSLCCVLNEALRFAEMIR